MIVDLGTGDGRAVLARAAADPRALVIGVDASADAMAASSRRADRDRLGNAHFLAGGVETLPGSPLDGVAHLATVTFPWSSLLRGLLGRDPAALTGIAATLRPGGRLEGLVSVVPSDGIAGLPCLTADEAPAIHAAWCGAGLQLDEMRRATPDEIAASGSAWARRLLSGRSADVARPVWRLMGRRSQAGPVAVP